MKNNRKNINFPKWIRQELKTDQKYKFTNSIINQKKINTICVSAHCPNRQKCWNQGTATFMILGDICTRNCAFCAVNHGIPLAIDHTEISKIADAIERIDLKYIVITSVTRDDLPDGGASYFAAMIKELRLKLSTIKIEVLTPDFMGDINSLNKVLEANPDVFSHNIETVKRLQKKLRPLASYDRSLKILEYSASKGVITKSSIIVGLGETEEEVLETITDLAKINCSIITIGQYLQPKDNKTKVERFVTPEEFSNYERFAASLNQIKAISAAPLVRSSYNAAMLYEQVKNKKNK